jgi:dynein assembly factor 5
VPNLVWRAGKPAEHVRLAAMTCLSKLLPLGVVIASALAKQLEAALPIVMTCLDDDNVNTRRLSCAVLEAVRSFSTFVPAALSSTHTHQPSCGQVLRKLPPRLVKEEWTRKIYPELLKRLDDASDGVRLAVCVCWLNTVPTTTLNADPATLRLADR